MTKIYQADLTAEERGHPLKLINSGEHSARMINRVRDLLLGDEVTSDQGIVEALTPTVQQTRTRFAEGGLDGAPNGRPRIGCRLREELDEKDAAVLETVARS